MSFPVRFCDARYKNWLKCGLSLIVLKEGLHLYVDEEVRNLHSQLKQKVSTCLGGSSATVQCGICTWRNIKYDKHWKKWYMNCSKNICNVWLREILLFHNASQSSGINWGNCDISQWPFDPYQVAKAFMPKGQARATQLPEDLDAPAILSLLYYCYFFSCKVPNIQLLCDLIEVRNLLFHSGDFHVSDTDKDTWINKMLQLLQYLNLQGCVYSEITKIKEEDLDASFQGKEIKVLKDLVYALTNDLSITTIALRSLQDSTSSLSSDRDAMNVQVSSLIHWKTQKDEETKTLQDNSSKIAGKIVTMETEMNEMKNSLNQCTKDFNKFKVFLDNNSDIDDQNIMTKMKNMGETISQIQVSSGLLEDKQEYPNEELIYIRSGGKGVKRKQEHLDTLDKSDLDIVGRKRTKFSSELSVIVPDVDQPKKRKIDEEKYNVATVRILGEQENQLSQQEGKEQNVMHPPEEGNIKTLVSSFEDVNQHANISSRDLDTLKTELKTLKTRFQTTEQNIDNIKSLESSFEDLKEEMSIRNRDIDTLKTGLECLQTRFKTTERSIEPIDILSRIDKLEDIECIIGQKVNRTKLNQRIDLTKGRIERHKIDNTDVHVTTKAFDHARDILFQHKHLVVQGTPGEGKTYLSLSLIAHLIEKNKELQPVQIHNATEWDEMVDTKRPLVVFLDDVLGKYGISETDLDRWKQISELIHPNLSSSSIFLTVCIRTQIVLSIRLSLMRNEALSFMFNSHVVDIGNEKHCLTKEERVQMLMKYAPKSLDRNDTVAFEDISEIKNNVIGFPQNCRMLRSRKHLMVDLKEVFSNNWFLVEEIQELSKTSPEIYTFLVLLMLSGGHLSFENKMEEIHNKIKTISDYCGLKEKLAVGKLKDIGHSLCGTFVEYKIETETFNFQHDCIETAVFVSFAKVDPGITLRMCSLKQLSKMCCVKKELARCDCEDFLNFKIMIDGAHFQIVHERFKEGLESVERDSFKSIAEALVWKDMCFVNYFSKTITSVDDVLHFVSKIDSNGHSLLIHLIYAKSTIVVERIINKISQCCLQDHNIVERQLLLATTNACLAEENNVMDKLFKLRGNVDDFVMLAGASAGNVSIMEGLLQRNGNINAALSIEDINDLAKAIKNCISQPKNSSYHNDINLFHIACSYGRTDMVKYLITSYPHLVHKTSSLGYTAAHFVAFSDKVELMEVLSAENVDIERKNSDIQTVLQIAANRSNKTMVSYLIKTWPQLMQTIDKNGRTAIHSAAIGGSVPVMEALVEAGLDITARANDGSHVLHIGASHDNLTIVKYLIETNPQLLQQTENHGFTAVHYAAAGGSVPVMEALVEAGLDITARANDGSHVLHIAAIHDNLTIVKYLIETNPQLSQQTENCGWTAVHYAAAGGSVPVMEALVEAGLDITARSNDGSHVLHIAARHDNLTIVKYLIETNHQLLQQTENRGWTAVHMAAAGGSVPVMEALVEAGLDITARANDGYHVLHIAANNDNLTIVKYLIETNPQLLQQTENSGWTAVHTAAARGSVPVMEALVEAGLDITARANDGSHVLHIAAIHDNLTIVKYLIETNPQLLQQTENHGFTAVHYAATGGSVPVMEALVEAGLDITARANVGSHVLHIAAIHDNLTIVKYLIETNPQLLQQTENCGWTAVHYAAAGGSVPVMEALVEAGLDITARSNDGSHVLHIAARHDNLTIVKYLIETNHQLLQQTENRGWTAVHYAAARGSVPVMEALVEAGLDITARANDGSHVLHIAANNDNLTIVKYLIEKNPQLLQQTENRGWTAVHTAAARGSVPVMEALVEAGLDITARANDGSHVLHIAAGDDNLTIVKYLIETNPQLLQQTENRGFTAVHYAAAGGSVPVMEALVEAGLDITARANDGYHVLHIAANNDNLTIVKYLIETNPQLLQQTENSGWTAVHTAAARGSVPVMEALVEAGLDITARANDGSHVLHIAAIHDNLTIVKYLIETNPQLLQQTENRGWTAVHMAAARGSVPVMEALVETGLDITARANAGYHVLHIAANNDNLTIVKYLIETNPQLLQQTENRGWTAVHTAAARGSVPVMEALVEAGLDITARANDGSHVLHIAARLDNLTIVKYLIETNPQLLQQSENRGFTAVHYAAAGGSVPVMEALVEAGLDITARGNDGSHVLHIAARHDNLTIVKYLIETNHQLLQQTENRGWTAVHTAAAGGSVPVMEALVEAGLDITARANDGSHVLHIAARHDNLTIVKYLIETNPQLLQKTENRGWTAVHTAAAGGSVPVMEALVEAGLDITARANDGSHVLHIAAIHDNLTTENRGFTAVHYASAGGNVPVMAALTETVFDITSGNNDDDHILLIETDSAFSCKILIASVALAV